MVDVSKLYGSVFLKIEDIKTSGPTRVRIIDAVMGRYDKMDLTFDDNTMLSVNKTNGRVLAKAYGFQSSDWIDKEVELSVGEVPGANGQPQESILIKAISPATNKAPPTKPVAEPEEPVIKRDPRDDMNDEIPFS